jgi:hypothetical protein
MAVLYDGERHRRDWSGDAYARRVKAESQAREQTDAMCEAIIRIFVLFIAAAALLLYLSGP